MELSTRVNTLRGKNTEKENYFSPISLGMTGNSTTTTFTALESMSGQITENILENG